MPTGYLHPFFTYPVGLITPQGEGVIGPRCCCTVCSDLEFNPLGYVISGINSLGCIFIPVEGAYWTMDPTFANGPGSAPYLNPSDHYYFSNPGSGGSTPNTTQFSDAACGDPIAITATGMSIDIRCFMDGFQILFNVTVVLCEWNPAGGPDSGVGPAQQLTGSGALNSPILLSPSGGAEVYTTGGMITIMAT
jgi:hypothetical protein